MGWSHRYVLRVTTDMALVLFVFSAIGAVLWVTDEFLGWNVLPDWIDQYAQLIVVVLVMAAALATGMSLLCGVALLAEAAAERAGIRDYKTPSWVWRGLGVAIVLFAVGILASYRIDRYRKEVARREARTEEAAMYEEQVVSFRAALPGVIEAFPMALVEAMHIGTLPEKSQEMVTFLSAIRSSTVHRPDVVVLTRAAAPYRFCRYTLRSRQRDEATSALGRHYLETQFYTGFPSKLESETVQRLFEGGTVLPLAELLEGEVIDNRRPGAWGVLRWENEVVGVLVMQGTSPNRFGFYHSGQSEPGQGQGHVPDPTFNTKD